MQELLGFVVAGLALAGSPGPNTLSLAAAGAAFGTRVCLNYLLGLVIGMIVVMAITATGIMAVVLAVPGATPLVIGFATAYFIYLAVRIATAPPLATEASAQGRPSLASGIVLSLFNPKAYAAMAALFSGFTLLDQHPVSDAVTKGLVTTLILLLVNIAWLMAGAAMTKWFRDPKSNRVVNICFAVLLLLSVLAALIV